MTSRALATLDLVDHDDARPAFPTVYLEGHTVLSYGELAGSADESGRDAYCRLARALGEEFTVLGIQAAGLCSDAEPRRMVPAMAAAYAGTVRAVRPTGPYLAGGCGISAAIACEMAARLDDVRLVAATGTGLPEPPDTGTESWLDEPPRQPGAWPARCASCSADQ